MIISGYSLLGDPKHLPPSAFGFDAGESSFILSNYLGPLYCSRALSHWIPAPEDLVVNNL